jgi:hypothetical protein
MTRELHRRPLAGRLTIAATSLIGALLVLSQVATAAAPDADIQAAQAASARFNSLGQAAAAGYGLLPEGTPLHECIASFDGSGAMGFHYVNGSLLDTTLSADSPEALVFAPDGHGHVKLVALEYVVFQDPWVAEHGSAVPELFGRRFDFVGAPNRYELPAFYALHFWLWEPNPAGPFAPFNPAVSCNP